MLRKILGTAHQLREVGHTTRSSITNVNRPRATGCEWKAELRIDGLPKARREELVDKLEEVLPKTPNYKRLEPRNDGNLYLIGSLQGPTLGVVMNYFISFFARTAQDIGLEPEEIKNSYIGLDITTVEDSTYEIPKTKGIRGRIAHKAGAMDVGLLSATAQLYDQGARQKLGDKTGEALLTVVDIDPADRAELIEFLEAEGEQRKAIEEGVLPMTIGLEQIGSPLGALSLTSRKMERALSLVGPGAAVEVITRLKGERPLLEDLREALAENEQANADESA